MNAAKPKWPAPVSAAVRSRNFPFATGRKQVSAEARGRLRLFWATLEAEANRVRRAVEAIPPVMASAAVRQGVGATPAMNRICGRIPLDPLTRTRRRCVWRFLSPIIDGTEPPAIVVQAVLLGAVNRQPLVVEPFGLTVTWHALGRLIDQDAKADLPAAMFEAHDHLAILPTTCGKQVFGLSDVLLPAGPGAFLVSPPSRDHEGPMLVAKTWVGVDQFSARQAGDFLAWGKLIGASVPA